MVGPLVSSSRPQVMAADTWVPGGGGELAPPRSPVVGLDEEDELDLGERR